MRESSRTVGDRHNTGTNLNMCGIIMLTRLVRSVQSYVVSFLASAIVVLIRKLESVCSRRKQVVRQLQRWKKYRIKLRKQGRKSLKIKRRQVYQSQTITNKRSKYTISNVNGGDRTLKEGLDQIGHLCKDLKIHVHLIT